MEGIVFVFISKVAKYFLKRTLNYSTFGIFIKLIALITTIKINRYLILLSILFCFILKGYSQDGFSLPNNIQKEIIKFKLINNLVVIPVEVNGAKLSFLLDTGVSSTIMFSLSEVDSIQLNNTKSVKLRGLGDGGNISALKSKNNILKIGNAIDNNHTVFVIFDQSLNLSTRMGVPIHGIIGFDFFRNLVVKTNYTFKKITLFNPDTYKVKKCKKCEVFDLIFQNKKAYLKMSVSNSMNDDNMEEVILLLDSGSSDAIWLFDDTEFKKDSLFKSFDDFLGEGLSGSIFGKRSKLSAIEIGSFKLRNVKVAFPDKTSLENIKFFDGRNGSIGGDILKRFTMIVDYPNSKISLKKNSSFKTPFHYNMSGLTLKHDGVILVKGQNNFANSPQSNTDGAINISIKTIYNFYLAPRFVVSEIRENSPADLAGIKKGDEILTVNGKVTHNYELQDIIGLFASKAGKKISIKIMRKGEIFRKKFVLKEVL